MKPLNLSKPLTSASPMPFGKYMDRPMGQVPLDYLRFLWFRQGFSEKAHGDPVADYIRYELAPTKKLQAAKDALHSLPPADAYFVEELVSGNVDDSRKLLSEVVYQYFTNSTELLAMCRVAYIVEASRRNRATLLCVLTLKIRSLRSAVS